jgi:hypothetical protein
MDSTAANIIYFRDGALYALPNPVRFADDRLRVAIASRNEATLRGTCPTCGAEAVLPNRAQRRRRKGQVTRAVMRHDAGCPSGDDRLRDLLAETEQAA